MKKYSKKKALKNLNFLLKNVQEAKNQLDEFDEEIKVQLNDIDEIKVDFENTEEIDEQLERIEELKDSMKIIGESNSKMLVDLQLFLGALNALKDVIENPTEENIVKFLKWQLVIEVLIKYDNNQKNDTSQTTQKQSEQEM